VKNKHGGERSSLLQKCRILPQHRKKEGAIERYLKKREQNLDEGKKSKTLEFGSGGEEVPKAWRVNQGANPGSEISFLSKERKFGREGGMFKGMADGGEGLLKLINLETGWLLYV